MIEKLKKLPTATLPVWVDRASFFVLLIGSFCWGYLFSEPPRLVFDSMNGAMTYLSIITSVSFAVLALLAQLFEKRTSASMNDHLYIIGTYKSHVRVEGLRMVFMIIPVILFTILSISDIKDSRFASTVLIGFTVFALSISVMLPFKYAILMKSYITEIFNNAEKAREKANAEQANKILGQQ